MGVDDAILALQNEEVIRLKLQKGEGDQESEQLPVVYTVELVRRGGPLGITISGTESPNDPIFISGLAEGIHISHFFLSKRCQLGLGPDWAINSYKQL